MSARRGLRILMTADAVGGVWQYATGLSCALADLGHEVILSILGPDPSPDQLREAERIPGLRLVLTGLPLDWVSSGPEPVRAAAREVAELAARERVDVVHCNTPALIAAADFSAPVVAVTHGCVATWWQAAKDEPLAPDFRWHREMTRQGLLAADVIVSPSASYSANVRQLYHLSTYPLVVHNGRDPVRVECRAGTPLKAALTVGRQWDKVKNAEMLDRVAASLDVPLFAAGALRGPNGEEFSPSHLQPLGHLDAEVLAKFVSLKPVFVSAATFEPFGLAVLEAANAGCPLVLSDIPTFRELWDGVALFADPDDPESFIAAIEHLLGDADLRARMGKAACQRSENFTPQAMASEMLPVYSDLLERTEVAA